ncbi:MAG: UDP-glucose 4-epimerase GalE [Planctomycetaceae bacterium]|nr:UDP-glucose 4-epimerase GalE [Planctomycetaceae bacterium]
MNILCTGGAGYVGSACLRWLLRHGHEAIAYDDLSAGNAEAVPDGRLIVGDILNGGQLTDVMAQHHVDAVMHFAAVASVPESISDPDLYYRVNVLGTKNVLDAMRRTGVNRIVFSSTAATYGFDNPMPLTEDADQLPETPYGTTKLAAERMIADYARAYDFGYAWLRYFNASGADLDGQFGEDRDHETHLIPIIFQVVNAHREKLMIYGGTFDTRDGTCVRDYVHTDDLGQAHQRVIEALKPGDGRAYNLGSGTGATVMEVLRAAENVVGHPIAHEIVDPRPGDPAVLIAGSDRIRSDLGWDPQHSDVETIVASAWRWHQQCPDGYASKPEAAAGKSG